MINNSMNDQKQTRQQGFYKINLILLAGGALFFTNIANAAVWLFDPSVRLEHSYDENFRLSTNSSQEDDVGTTRLVGELALKGKSERMDIKSFIRLDKAQYSGDDDNLSDRNNQLLGLRSKFKGEREKYVCFSGYFAARFNT